MVRNVTDYAWNFLFNLYLVIAVIVGVLVLGWLVYSLARFRERPGYEPPDAPMAGAAPVERGHVFWVYVMAGAIAVVLFGLVLGTAELVNVIEEPPEEPGLIVNVTGFQFGWQFAYPEGFTTFGDLRVPVDTLVVARVNSTDVLHNFAIPDLNNRIDAMPGRHTELWFRATSTGNASIRCAEFCGVGHAYMVGTLSVLPQDEFEAWVGEQTDETPQEEASETNATLTRDALALETRTFATGEPVRVRVTNLGEEPHALAVGEWSPYKWERRARWITPPLEPGESRWLEIRWHEADRLEAWCPIPGHDHSGAPVALEVARG